MGMPWTALDVPDMWAMVADDDDEPSWQQVIGWFLTHDLLDGYRQRLQSCRDALASRWPTGRGDAARAFIDRLDEMITTVSRAAAAAIANATALQDITNALTGAKQELRPLHERWQRYALAESGAAALSDAWGVSA